MPTPRKPSSYRNLNPRKLAYVEVSGPVGKLRELNDLAGFEYVGQPEGPWPVPGEWAATAYVTPDALEALTALEDQGLRLRVHRTPEEVNDQFNLYRRETRGRDGERLVELSGTPEALRDLLAVRGAIILYHTLKTEDVGEQWTVTCLANDDAMEDIGRMDLEPTEMVAWDEIESLFNKFVGE